ncbi:DUF423 domain-containing protein [Methylocapsa palsarum]|uniref:Uncharacterized membrane protein YgdD, TMEM256/DUF423 family n=1 Tax=Methylocapsa palsarum TaxID=1612308 RepID=A0A1I3YLQ5_9HYPH|nr:DUF423 domain-containing protein [Methylocapsa palsarum]SFK32690.1 Uncharacterized membrane protein YgdD, TMEM256/DUF423 family [Methylocapsa palsarum]
MRKWAYGTTFFAGLAGGGGVILAAMAAHGVADPKLQTAAEFLMIHAAAAIAVTAVSVAAPQTGVWFLGAASFFLIGSLLFCGDLSVRALNGSKLFAFAAPAGGVLLILGWAWTATAAAVGFIFKPRK